MNNLQFIIPHALITSVVSEQSDLNSRWVNYIFILTTEI